MPRFYGYGIPGTGKVMLIAAIAPLKLKRTLAIL